MNIPLRGTVDVKPFPGKRCLHRALSVVQFSAVLKIGEPGGVGVAAFQEAVRHIYPVLEQDVEHVVQLTMQDREVSQQLQQHTVWRLSDIEQNWRVSLTTQSIAIECHQGYHDRYDFAERARFLIDAVGEHFKPAQSLRKGTRFVNLAPPSEIIGHCADKLVSITGEPELELAELTWRFPVEEGTLLLRSGIVPPNVTYEPVMVPPQPNRTWFLDIDVFNDDAAPYDVERLADSLAGQIDRAHAIYIWAMTNNNVPTGEKL